MSRILIEDMPIITLSASSFAMFTMNVSDSPGGKKVMLFSMASTIVLVTGFVQLADEAADEPMSMSRIETFIIVRPAMKRGTLVWGGFTRRGGGASITIIPAEREDSAGFYIALDENVLVARAQKRG